MRRLLTLLAFSAAAAFAQTPTVTSVTNSQSYGTQLCPGLVATVFGTNFGTTTANVTVKVGTLSAFVGPVTASQFSVVIPYGASVGATTLTVTVSGVASAPFPITLSAVSPFFDTQAGSGTGLATVYDVTAANALVTAAAPAHVGDAVFAYAVGLGPTNPPTPDEANGLAPATSQVSPLPTVTVGGVAATVAFAGVTQGGVEGIYQVNFTIPAGVSGTVPLVISAGGVSSATLGVNSAVVTIAVVGTLAAPTVTGVQNAASFGTTLAPGLQAIIYGSGFGTTAANVSFSVGGKPGYVIPPISTNQLLVQLPFEASTGATSLTVTVGGVASNAFNITLNAVSPAFLIQNSAASGLADVIETSTNTVVTLAAPAKDGDTLYTYAVGLGPTNPPSATGVQTASNPTAALPTVTVGGVAATGVSAGLTKAYVGVYQVNFTVPSGVQGTVPLVITIGGVSSATNVTLATPGISYVENNATNSTFAQTPISPGSIATVYANSIGTSTNVLSGLFPATTSNGVQVTFNGTAAPLFDVVGTPLTKGNPQQIDILVPTNLPTSGTVNVQLTTSGAFYANFPVTMAPSNPAFYRLPDPKVPTLINVIAQFANTVWLALPNSTTANVGLPQCNSSTNVLVVCGQPATIGDTLVLYATGLGLATPGGSPTGSPLTTGQVAPVSGNPLYETPTTPVVTIGGVPAKVLFSGVAPGTSGEYQIDVTVPSGIASGDSVPISISILGATDNSTTISIQPRGPGQSAN
jgi:uncharacterized protein (TIGR03437 family)